MTSTPEQVSHWNEKLGRLPPIEIVRWAVRQPGGRAIVSTNFRPYEAVILHLATRVDPEIPVLWVDHGYNRPATYRHAEDLRRRLGLNLKPYLPRITRAHRDAIEGPVPSPADEEGLKRFSAAMKLEPFQRGMRELAPSAWITGLRATQNAGRAGLDVVSADPVFGALKVNPVFRWTDEQMEDYLREHALPNEWDYFDPAKADEKRECGLHAPWGAGVVGVQGEIAR